MRRCFALALCTTVNALVMEMFPAAVDMATKGYCGKQELYFTDSVSDTVRYPGRIACMRWVVA